MNGYMNILEKAAITGAYTSLASIVTTGSQWRVPCPTVFGMGGVCPLWVFAACAGIIASAINDGVHYLIRSEVHIKKKAQDEASLYLGAIVGAASYYCVMYFANPYLARDIGSFTLLASGVAAETLASLTYNMVA